MKDLIIVGIRGFIVALDRTTGSERWRTKLKGYQTILFTVDGAAIYATANGEAWCLDITTGSVLWRNPLTGLGLGLATIGAPTMPADQARAVAQLRASQAASAG